MKRMLVLLMFLFPLRGLSQEYAVGDHELLIMPTAYTMPGGAAYFSDYELFLLNYTRAVTPRTHVGFFSLFPITTDFLETLTFGMKQNYWRTPAMQAALWATLTPKVQGLVVGNVLSIGKRTSSLHLGLSMAVDLDGSSTEFIFMGGYRYDASRRTALIIEYTNFSSFIDEDFGGFISLGVRFRGEKMAWELGGIRPLASAEGLLFLPFLKATLFFD